MISSDTLTPFQEWIALGICLDREALEAVIRMSDSSFGKKLIGVLITDPEEKDMTEKAFAMLKPTVFYLNELHKLFPTTGEEKP